MFQLDLLREDLFRRLPRYRYLSLLGRGGMGIVFKVRDIELDETIALKVLVVPGEEDVLDAFLLRFKREVSLNRRVKHPNVARLFDFGRTGPFAYLTMELVSGADLGSLIEQGPIAPARAVALLRQVAQGVGAAHREGIVHRDIKPQNIMLTAEGRVMLLDFGLARTLAVAGLTLLGTTVGTPHYMSPEQARGERIDGRSDLYAIGAVAFEMLTGRVLFDGSEPLAIATRHLEERVPLEALRERGVPPALVDVVAQCLAKEAGERFQTAEALDAALAVSLRNLPTQHAMRRATPAKAPLAKTSRVAEASPADLEWDLDGGHPAPASRRAPCVAIADDDAGVRKLLTRALALDGVQSLEAGDGQQALELVEGGRVDLLLLDLRMPRLDGFDALRALRATPAGKDLPVIVMSGNLPGPRIAVENGADDVATKPIAVRSLLDKAWALLARRGFERAAHAA